MTFKQMREAREEAYGRKVPGIRAFFSFWCPLIAVLYILNIADYVMDWNGNAFRFVMDLLICFLALSSAILGRFWEKEAFILMVSAIISFLVYAVFIGAYTAIFVKHRTMFIAPISVLRGDEQWD